MQYNTPLWAVVNLLLLAGKYGHKQCVVCNVCYYKLVKDLMWIALIWGQEEGNRGGDREIRRVERDEEGEGIDLGT